MLHGRGLGAFRGNAVAFLLLSSIALGACQRLMRSGDELVPGSGASSAPPARASPLPAALAQATTCMTPQRTAEAIGLTFEPTTRVVLHNGNCYYFAKAQESCHDACSETMGGICDDNGTEMLAQNISDCAAVIKDFGHTQVAAKTESGVDRSGCSYSDLGEASRVQVMKKDGAYPLCGTRNLIAATHRICACKAIFGDLDSYTKTSGQCTAFADGASTGTRQQVASGHYMLLQECKDECDRDIHCGAFSFVTPWSPHESHVPEGHECIFYAREHEGDGADMSVSCLVKARYTATHGECKRPDGSRHRVGTISVSTVKECEKACDDESGCFAFGVPIPDSGNDALPTAFNYPVDCQLFADDHRGNGEDGYRCYLKAVVDGGPQ